ncbi:OmpA family protein [Nibribacter ruber]|uniref:OmpA family protein n=2 Tax=Nibribacter ruber TaxID=2698458 RepID=A0A6P1P4K9_9BACT|nr:OmpA family protein [Nibribacter ruber]
MAHPVAYSPVPLSPVVNAMGMQYSPVLTANQQELLFTARSGRGALDDEDLYLSVKKEGQWQAPVSVSDQINTDLNEGAATFSADGRVLVFTSCNRQDSFGSCDLYISYKEGENWSKPVNMGRNVNTSSWDSQPSLSADGRTIYFASNRKGGLGNEDIWVTRQQEDGSWEVPVNAGSAINSSGREAAPFLHASGATLYFATDGRLGMGGLDLFKATRQAHGWAEPVNLGYPLNTHRDETSLFITADNQLGYYSGQPAQPGQVLIGLSQFEVPAVWKGNMTSSFAQGTVYDAVTKKPIAAQVQVYDLDSLGVVAQQVPSDKQTGAYTIVVNQGQQYALYVTAPGYVLESRHLSAVSTAQPLALDFYLQPIGKGKKAILSNLFFDTGKATLRKESRTELDKLFQFMKSNPGLKVEIAGHTDNVGQPASNLKLSQARAQEVVHYLVSKGIPASTFLAKGYGETQPTVPNTSDQNRQLNRRIELRIL